MMPPISNLNATKLIVSYFNVPAQVNENHDPTCNVEISHTPDIRFMRCRNMLVGVNLRFITWLPLGQVSPADGQIHLKFKIAFIALEQQLEYFYRALLENNTVIF